MQRFHDHSATSHVTALFADRALSFALKKGATFEDLVNGLIMLGQCDPLAVIVNLDPGSEQQSVAAIAVVSA